jgi:1-acyl-sn-glycerol-3-phosphate acyltransferase
VAQYQLSRIVAGPFLRALGRPRIVGAENIPESGGAILAANHSSAIDSVYLPFMVERPVTFSAKIEYFGTKRPGARLFAMYMKATNQLQLDRDGGRAAQATLEAALKRLEEGQLFGIYPEGTRSPDGRLYRGRQGVGWLALKSGLPVIPVGMMGTRQVLPPGSAMPRPGRVEIRVGKPLTFGPEVTDQAPAKARREITERITEAIRELTGQEYVHQYSPGPHGTPPDHPQGTPPDHPHGTPPDHPQGPAA